MIYCDYVILGQIVALRHPPEKIDEAIENDDTNTLVKMFMPLVFGREGDLRIYYDKE